MRIARTVVHPEFRGLGLGQLLVRHAIDFARDHWHVADLKPLFMEIVADMLKFVPFSRDPIEIQALDENEAVRFLKEVLRNYRSDQTDPAEYPFREDALRRIAEKTPDKTAASLFRSARRVLERSVLDGKLTPGGWIETDDVDEILG